MEEKSCGKAAGGKSDDKGGCSKMSDFGTASYPLEKIA
jgi:hypothetical protein